LGLIWRNLTHKRGSKRRRAGLAELAFSKGFIDDQVTAALQHNLAKVRVDGSNPFARSIFIQYNQLVAQGASLVSLAAIWSI
jgi:hypothetical protein